MAEMMMSSTSSVIAPKEPISDPEIRRQKGLNCWHIGSQLVEELPSWARIITDAAADAPVARNTSITFRYRPDILNWFSSCQ